MSKLSTRELQGLRLIEDTVNSYLRGKQSNPKLDAGINSALKRVINNDLMPTKKVHIIWNEDARSPFIMSITPNVNELYEKSEKINKLMNNPNTRNADVIKAWCEITVWYLEIDIRVLTKESRYCVDNGAQFVALLCHEIGHVMNENPMRLFYNYKKKSLKFSTLERIMLSNSKIVRAIMLPMYCHTLQFVVIVDRYQSNKEEIIADAYVPDDYKGDLIMYMNNHILNNPDTYHLKMDSETFDKEQEVGITLSRDSIEMLKGRRDILNKQIQSQYNSPNSGKFHKYLMKFIGKKLTGYDPEDDKYITGMKTIVENAYRRECELLEAKANAIVKNNARVTPRDIDVLEVQVSNIKTPEDKLYYINKLHDYIEALEYEGKNKVNETKLNRLYAIRDKIISASTSSGSGAKYGVFVKYPEGYEG